MAEAKLGNAERAWKYYTQLIPHVACQKVGVDRYQGEPYAYASNIVGPENSRFGWANVTQVTGTATWMDIAATQYLLGVRAELGGLRIDPCIPASWKHFEVTRRYRGCRVTIRVENPAGVQKGVKAISVDGRDVAMSHGPILPHTLIAGRNEVAVDVTMG
jgi:cellobiose phosphorylase